MGCFFILRVAGDVARSAALAGRWHHATATRKRCCRLLEATGRTVCGGRAEKWCGHTAETSSPSSHGDYLLFLWFAFSFFLFTPSEPIAHTLSLL